MTHSTDGTDCMFTYRVVRSGCTNNSNQTFTGTQTVPCGQTNKITFNCDPGGTCPGYELTLTGMDCPSPPTGGPAPSSTKLK